MRELSVTTLTMTNITIKKYSHLFSAFSILFAFLFYKECKNNEKYCCKRNESCVDPPNYFGKMHLNLLKNEHNISSS